MSLTSVVVCSWLASYIYLCILSLSLSRFHTPQTRVLLPQSPHTLNALCVFEDTQPFFLYHLVSLSPVPRICKLLSPSSISASAKYQHVRPSIFHTYLRSQSMCIKYVPIRVCTVKRTPITFSICWYSYLH